MIIKLKNKKIVFRNPEILAIDAKAINLEHILSNLFMLIAADGVPITLGAIKGMHTIESLEGYMKNLETKGLVHGVTDNMEAVEDWLRSNLVNMVFRGNVEKENVSALRPVHLMSYRIQNRKHNKDYNTSDQVYLMLRQSPEVMAGLKKYLSKGWDSTTNSIIPNDDLDVDTTGILFLTQSISEKKKPNVTINTTRPLLKKQTELFNDDIRRLLVYSNILPRNVFIEYLKTLIAFHLAIYVMKLVHLLPKMCQEGTTEVEDDWSMVVDLSDDLNSTMAPIACADVEKMHNSLNRYFKSTFEVNVIQSNKRAFGEPSTIEDVVKSLHDINKSEVIYKWEIKNILDNIPEEEDLNAVKDMLIFFDEEDYFDKYIYLLEKTSGGSSYQYKYYMDLLGNLCMKNTETKLMADGRRSRKHPRRGAMGSKLLETLVQILVLERDDEGKYHSRSFSIDELAQIIRDRYGLIINGANEHRFSNADVETLAAFQDNMAAFKNKLRQIGFYTDLSDACLLQKIRPRYNI